MSKLKVVGNEASAQVDELSQKLEAQLSEISHKKRLADNRSVFLHKKSALQEYKEQMEQEIEQGNFEQTKCKISFGSIGYSSREAEQFNISNAELILYFIEHLTDKIDEKIIKIESELIG